MKKTLRILIGLTAVAVVGMVIYRKRNRNTGVMLDRVADEGYETAHDVMYPSHSKRGKNLRFGPVLPR